MPLPALGVTAIEELHCFGLFGFRQLHRGRPARGRSGFARRHGQFGDRLAVVLKLAGGPERAAGHKVKELRCLDGVGVVADRCAEDAGLAVLVRPDDRLVGLPLAAHRLGQRLGGVPHLVAVIQFLLRNVPCLRKPGEDRVLGDEVGGVFIVGAVAGRRDADKLEPVVVAGPVAVHRAVHEHGGGALLMLDHDLLEELRILDAGEALVVKDHVVALRPVGLRIDGDLVVGGRATLVDHGAVDLGPRRQPLGDHLLLSVVVVAAAPGDVEHLERLARLSGPGDGTTGQNRQHRRHADRKDAETDPHRTESVPRETTV